VSPLIHPVQVWVLGVREVDIGDPHVLDLRAGTRRRSQMVGARFSRHYLFNLLNSL